MPARNFLPPALRIYAFAVGLALVIFLLSFFHLIDFHESQSIDLRFKIRGEEPSHPKVVMVEIDDASIAVMGQWPWPRNVHAVLLDILSRYEPSLIFFDILFTEQSPLPDADRQLADSIKRSGRVLLPFYYYSENPFQAFFPFDLFRENALGVGFVNADPDRDGVIRKFRTFIQTDEKVYYQPAVTAMFLLSPDARKAQAWFEKLPADHHDEMWLNYPGGLDSFQRLPFWKVVDAAGTAKEDEIREMIAGSIVIVGDVATGTTDIKATPFSRAMPGVVVQAAAFHTLMTGEFFQAVPWWGSLLIYILLAVAATWITQKFPPRRGIVYVFSGMIAYIVLNIAIFLFLRWIFPLYIPLIVMAVAYVGTLFAKYLEIRFKEELTARELKTAARIQENFLPTALPELSSLDVAFECRFAKQVGGDLYDWVDLGEGKLGVCIGDVSGKGVPAAIFMARVISEFRREQKQEEPGEVLSALNNRLAKTGTAGMFVTLFYAIIDTKTNKFKMSSGGHDPMIHYHAAQGKAELVEAAQGTPVGLFEGMPYESAEFEYGAGDLLVIVTDGIKELRDPKKEEYGMERLRLLVENIGKEKADAAQVLQTVFQATHAYQRGTAPHDDRTILCVHFKN